MLLPRNPRMHDDYFNNVYALQCFDTRVRIYNIKLFIRLSPLGSVPGRVRLPLSAVVNIVHPTHNVIDVSAYGQRRRRRNPSLLKISVSPPLLHHINSTL